MSNTNGDYISREAALRCATRNYYPSIDHYCRSEKVATRKDLEAIPLADVRPVVRGEWRRIKAPGFGYVCTMCGRWEPRQEPFCPCGADMRPAGKEVAP